MTVSHQRLYEINGVVYHIVHAEVDYYHVFIVGDLNGNPFYVVIEDSNGKTFTKATQALPVELIAYFEGPMSLEDDWQQINGEYDELIENVLQGFMMYVHNDIIEIVFSAAIRSALYAKMAYGNARFDSGLCVLHEPFHTVIHREGYCIVYDVELRYAYVVDDLFEIYTVEEYLHSMCYESDFMIYRQQIMDVGKSIVANTDPHMDDVLHTYRIWMRDNHAGVSAPIAMSDIDIICID